MNKVILRNILSLAGIQGFSYLLPLLTLPYLVRVLGPAGYGMLGYVLAVMQYGCLITDYGFNLSATRQVAVHRDDKNKNSQLYWNILSAKMMLMSISFLMLSLFSVFDKNLSNNYLVLMSAFGLVVGNVLFPVWLFQGKENMGWIAVANIVSRFTSVPLIFIFVKSIHDVWIAAFITGTTSVIAGLIGLIFIYKNKWIHYEKPTLGNIIFQLKEGWHIFISSAAINLYTASITVILGMVSGPVAVGYFVAADKIRLAVQGLIMPVAQALYPRINSLMSRDENAAFKMIRKMLVLQGGGAMLMSIALFTLSGEIIIRLYGITYTESIKAMHILAWLPGIIGVSNVFGYQTLLVLGKKQVFSRIVITGGISSLLMILPLIHLWGINGAAATIIITELLVNFMMLAYIIQKRIPIFPFMNNPAN